MRGDLRTHGSEGAAAFEHLTARSFTKRIHGRSGTRDAREVMPEGADAMHVKRSIPIEKAMAGDTLIVYAMNGHPLPPDHGFPVRMLIPGWVGVGHVKWLSRCEVSEEPLYSDYNTKRYVLIGPDHEARPPGLGPVLTTQKVKSAFELPWNGEVRSAQRLLRGRSWSGEGRIARVRFFPRARSSTESDTICRMLRAGAAGAAESAPHV